MHHYGHIYDLLLRALPKTSYCHMASKHAVMKEELSKE
jgi:hypothetical protein